MSDTWTCAACGKRYGADFGHCSGLCPRCESGRTPDAMERMLGELERENQELREKLFGLPFEGEGI